MIPFTEAMDTTCGLCDKPAKFHRLDSRDNLYCLALGYEGRTKEAALAKLGYPEWETMMYYTLPHEYLRTSTLSLEVGRAINRVLRMGTDNG